MSAARNRRVLIVDDDPGVRQVLRLILELEDFDVVGEAKDGLEAVPQAAELRPDVILLDQQMPRRDGATAAGMIRGLNPDTRIVAFSAMISKKPEWADAFLGKQHINEVGVVMEGLIGATSSSL